MIPILFETGTTNFNTNGLGRLAEIISCVVTEERNGIYECQFEYPITGKLFPELKLGRIISCTHDEKGDEQPFIIYRRGIPDLKGVVTFNAHHISYLLNDIVVKPFTAGSCSAALQGIKNNSVNTNPFSFWTDKQTTVAFNNDVPRNARNMLGGEENSILDVFGGGEYLFDQFTVRLYQNRGTDSGVEIRYGKNLIDLDQDIDNSDTYNAIVPYWADSEGTVMLLPEIIISYAEAGERVDAAPMDLSDAFEEQPTAAQLRARAKSRYESGNSWLPNENIKVDFVQLWQTEEYKNFAPLQRVGLCDTASIYYIDAGIENVRQKVVRVDYNVLLDRYDSMELGEIQPSLGQAIRQNVLETVPTSSMMNAAIQYATNMIRGGLGGYVVMTPGANGYPQEILIMDTPDVNTAVNVWRFNQGGLGHSSNGYQGPFSDIALTQDGRINASMITTGIINANLIRAGIIQDADAKNSWNLATGQFVTTQGTIGPFTIGAAGLSYNPTDKSKIEIGTSGISVSQIDVGYTAERTKLSGKAIVFGSAWTSNPNYSDIVDYFEMKCSPEDSTMPRLRISDITGDRRLISLYRPSDYEWPIELSWNTDITGNLICRSTKSRLVETENYSDRLLYCYETPTPLFGDIGEAVIGDDGFGYVDIDDIFTETIADKVEYQVFLQKEGEGDCWITEKTTRYFVIQGTPNLKVSWELKAKQRDYETLRLEPHVYNLDEYEYPDESDDLLNSYITEQEVLLYG